MIVLIYCRRLSLFCYCFKIGILFQEGRIRGTLFIPNSNEYQNGPYPTIISLYGGINQGKVVEERSALFASRGFVSLALAYFGVDGLPKNYFDLGKIVVHTIVAWHNTSPFL